MEIISLKEKYRQFWNYNLNPITGLPASSATSSKSQTEFGLSANLKSNCFKNMQT